MPETAAGDRNPAAFCPSCERFLGPAAVCPYCDADAAVTPAVRHLKYAAVLLGIVGLGLLYLAASRKPMSAVRVADITPTMNFAYVRIAGAVVRDAYVSKDDGETDYLSFLVDDGSGRIRIAAYGSVARALVGGDRVPQRGDQASAAGTLSVDADGTARLRVQSSRQVSITRQGDIPQDIPQDEPPP